MQSDLGFVYKNKKIIYTKTSVLVQIDDNALQRIGFYLQLWVDNTLHTYILNNDMTEQKEYSERVESAQKNYSPT